MENKSIVKASAISVTVNGKPIINNLSFDIKKGELWIITGASGSGKTTLLHVLAGKQFYKGDLRIINHDNTPARLVMVEQQHHFKNLSNVANFYYQQRFNSSDSEDAITVEEDLRNHLETTSGNEFELQEISKLFHLQQLLSERLIQLSNGENKRLQIAKALLDKPDILLLDNPFTGLDTEARKLLDELLTRISKNDIHIIMVSSSKHLPPFATHVLTLHEIGKFSISATANYTPATDQPVSKSLNEKLFYDLILSNEHTAFSYAVKMKNVHISYHNKIILDHVNWEVKQGERWSLSGPNGAGKSTLLSLITADNPQAYANEIYLFDRKRGSGETIWDIKKKIGYISPELHLHFDQSNNSFEVVASGLFDTIGLFRQLSDEQVALVMNWMKLLHIEHLRSKMLFQLSNSEQRMVLLARALVKNPPMLVLDEPCQGLDDQQVTAFKALINQVCLDGNKTLIYVSHYADEIPGCVDKYLKLDNGRVV